MSSLEGSRRPGGNQTVLMLGIPGSGKTSISVQLSQSLKGRHFPASSVLREYLSRQSDLVLGWEAYWQRGQNAPDGEVLPVLWQAYQENVSRFTILDGYPRTLSQLEDFLMRGGRLDWVVWLRVGQREARERIVKRSAFENRYDDGNAVVDERIAREMSNIDSLVNHKAVRDKVISVYTCERRVDEVCSSLRELLER
jgi:adenylate kinase